MTTPTNPSTMTTSQLEDFVLSCLHDMLEQREEPLPTTTEDFAIQFADFLTDHT